MPGMLSRESDRTLHSKEQIEIPHGFFWPFCAEKLLFPGHHRGLRKRTQGLIRFVAAIADPIPLCNQTGEFFLVRAVRKSLRVVSKRRVFPFTGAEFSDQIENVLEPQPDPVC